MCITPTLLPTGVDVPCRLCWQCVQNRVNDYVGRCIAEQQDADKVLAVTLTYRGDHPSAATLVYADFQGFMKRLRRRGYDVRYIVAGEYGKEKGRAHWHAVLFFKGKAPNVPIERNYEWDVWGHGFCYFQQPDYRGFFISSNTPLKVLEELTTGISPCPKNPHLGTNFLFDLLNGMSTRTWLHRLLSMGGKTCSIEMVDHDVSISKEKRVIITSGIIYEFMKAGTAILTHSVNSLRNTPQTIQSLPDLPLTSSGKSSGKDV